MSQKRRTLACYNVDMYEPILLILWLKMLLTKYAIKTPLLSHLTQQVLLHYLAKHGNTKIAHFRLNAISLLFQTSTSRCLISSIFMTWTCNSYSYCY